MARVKNPAPPADLSEDEPEAEVEVKQNAEQIAKSGVQEQTAEQAADEAEDGFVKMNFTKPCRFNVNNHHVINFRAGLNKVPVEHKDNWWLKAHGAVEV